MVFPGASTNQSKDGPTEPRVGLEAESEDRMILIGVPKGSRAVRSRFHGRANTTRWVSEQDPPPQPLYDQTAS